MSFEPTPEQVAIREVFASGDTLTVSALAGTGKTTTLKMLAKDAPQTRMTYVAFNRAIADEARRTFPSNVVCSTMHSFAFRALGQRFVPGFGSDASVSGSPSGATARGCRRGRS